MGTLLLRYTKYYSTTIITERACKLLRRLDSMSKYESSAPTHNKTHDNTNTTNTVNTIFIS